MVANSKTVTLVSVLLAAVISVACKPNSTVAVHPPYTPKNPNFFSDNGVVSFSGQVKFNSVPLYYAWGVKINPGISGTIVGPVTENTKVKCNGVEVSNSHHVQAADYLFHGSNKVDTACPGYDLEGTLTFIRDSKTNVIDFFDVFTVKQK